MSSRCVYHVLSHNTVSRLNSIKKYQEAMTTRIFHHFGSSGLVAGGGAKDCFLFPGSTRIQWKEYSLLTQEVTRLDRQLSQILEK